jgi:type IV secretory pathway VirB10-like protein
MAGPFTETDASARLRAHRAAWAVVPIAAVLAIFCGGCAEKKAHAQVPAANVPPAKPIPVNAPSTPPATPPAVKAPANSGVDLPETDDQTPAELVKPAAPPPKPKPEVSAPVRTPPPQISPQLSAADQAAFEQKTNENIAGAEKNLQQASGHSLNSAQNDLVEKIKVFLDQARDAAKEGDLARAQNLSQKAYLLSVELVNSL